MNSRDIFYLIQWGHLSPALSQIFDDLEDNNFEALIVRSISLKEDEDMKRRWRSVSLNYRNSEPSILKSFGSGKMIIEGSLSFNGRGLDHPFHLETKFLFKNPSLPKESQLKLDNINEKEIGDPLLAQNTLPEMAPQSPSLKSSSPKHEAAVTLQKVYKSFRTRRQLADCAVLVQQHWYVSPSNCQTLIPLKSRIKIPQGPLSNTHRL